MENTKAKVVIITGASSGIGEATARLLARNGEKVVLAARREDRLKIIADEIARDGGEAVFTLADVAAKEDMQGLVNFALATYGRVDVLVNNAGVMPASRLHELRVEEWEQMIDVNIKGVLYGIAAVLPVMRSQQSGHIINLSSVAGHVVSPTSAVYSATKSAVLAITEGLRQEEAPAIRTTVISPGLTQSELLNAITSPEVQAIADHIRSLGISPYRIAEAIAYAIRQPEDTTVSEMMIRPSAQGM